VPVIVTHDGRTIRYPDPLVRVLDSVVVEMAENKIKDFIKFELGNLVMVTGGRNTGRVGVVAHRERHKGVFDICHIKDANGALPDALSPGCKWAVALRPRSRPRRPASEFDRGERYCRHASPCSQLQVRGDAGAEFATRMTNVFVIGKGNKPMVSLPKTKGIKLSIIQEMEARKESA
jgi:small subunit ribosomal protein S4e